MKIILTVFVLLFSVLSHAQGIKFEDASLSWTEIKAKASRENKPIFMDCYTTWCGPCKRMEREVFTVKEVGDYFNTHYINVKLQIDSTLQDNENIKSWYKDVHEIVKAYDVHIYPCYLFFSPQGNALHKIVGYREANMFVNAATDARDPGKQYYNLITNWQAHANDKNYMVRVLQAATDAGDEKVMKLFVEASLFSTDQKLTKKMAESIFSSTHSSTDKGFSFLLTKMDSVDELLGKSQITANKLRSIIYREQIAAALKPGADWKEMSRRLTAQYPLLYKNSSGEPDSSFLYDLLQLARHEGTKEDVIIINDAYQSVVPDRFARNNLQVLLDITSSTKDNSFSFLLKNAVKANEVLGKNLYKKLSLIILRDTLIPIFRSDKAIISYASIMQDLMGKYPLLHFYIDSMAQKLFYNLSVDNILKEIKKYPAKIDWQSLNNKMNTRFPGYDYQYPLLMAECKFYENQKMWDKCEKTAYLLFKKYGDKLGDVQTNELSWDYIFQHSDNKKYIDEAIKRMKIFVESDPPPVEMIDTYANLLYKAGDNDTAILWEKKALALAIEYKDIQLQKLFQDTLDKMSKKEKTW
jgi:thioredoxin-related protein